MAHIERAGERPTRLKRVLHTVSQALRRRPTEAPPTHGSVSIQNLSPVRVPVCAKKLTPNFQGQITPQTAQPGRRGMEDDYSDIDVIL